MSAVPIEEVLKYLNEARTNPKGFVKYVQEDIDSFISNTQMPLRPGMNYQVNESKKTWFECKEFLEKQKPLPPFKLSESLNLTAEDHAIDLVKHDMFGHTSSDGSDLTTRIKRRCGTRGYGLLAENIGSDFLVKGRNHALKTVLGLIVDDGVPSRGHRDNIYSNTEYIGICSKVQGDKIITVMNFHSQNLPLKNSSSNKDQTGGKIQYNEPSGMMKPKGFGDLGKFMKESELPVAQSEGSRFAVSKSMSTSTSIVNGKKTVKTTETIQYNDGSVETLEKIEESDA